MKFDIRVFFENLSRIFNFHEQLTRIAVILYEDQHTFWSYLAEFFVKWETFQAKDIQKSKYILLVRFFSPKIVSFLWDNVEKYCKAGQATDDSMAHAHCMLHNWGYRQTLRIWNTYSSSTARMVARTSLIVTLYSKQILHFILTRWILWT
jgi:hypothetical protein